MKIAVFGATGVIGSALIPALAERHEVVAVSRREQTARHHGVRAAVADVRNAKKAAFTAREIR